MDFITPGVAGLISGYLVSIPVGPVNITVMNEALTRGFLRPFLIGIGAVTAEAIYCGLALAGFQSVLTMPTVHAVMVLTSFLVVTILGFKYLLMQKQFGDTTALRVEHELEKKLHLHRGYWLGFAMTFGNPCILLVWGMLAAVLFEHGWVRAGFSQLVMVAGMMSGGTLWFLTLSWATSRGHHRVSPRTLHVLTRLSGAFLLVAGVLLGAKLVQAMAASDLYRHFH
jgi:L-lysine exporter family protein LysE/ArgO